MANGMIAQTRQAAQNQMAPHDFLSFGNLKKFGGDLLSGAVPGAVGGGLFQLGAAGYNALQAAPTSQILPGGAQLIQRNALQNRGDLAKALQGSTAIAPQGSGLDPYMGRNIQSMLPNALTATAQQPGFLQQAGAAIGGFQAVSQLISKLSPQEQPQASGMSQALQQGPRASSGPIAQGSSGQGMKPYYAFEQFLRSNNDMRPMIQEPDFSGRETAPGVTGNAPNQPQVTGQAPNETIGEQEDVFRPKSGISRMLYDATKYIETSPMIQGGVGLAATGLASYLSGGLATPFAAGIGAAAGGATKGIAGQLRQWLSVKQQQEQQAQQSGVAQPLMQGA